MKNLFLLSMFLLAQPTLANIEYQDFFGNYEAINGENCVEAGFGEISVKEWWVNNTYNDNLTVDGVDSSLSLSFYGINLGKIKYQARGPLGPCIKKNVTLEDGVLTLKEKSCGLNFGFYKTRAEMYFQDGYLIVNKYHSNPKYAFSCVYKKI